jgi:hypothetical protein
MARRESEHIREYSDMKAASRDASPANANEVVNTT